MVKAPTMGPSAGSQGIRKIHPGSEIAINPRDLPNANITTPNIRADGKATSVYHPQVDVSTQVDLHGGFAATGGNISIDWDRRATPLYSREDIKEQYCITSRQLDAVEKSGGGFFGCLSTRGPSPCSAARTSILSACVRSVPSDENLCDAPYPRRPLQILYRQPYPTRGLSRYDFEDEADWIESSYFRRRPRSFCTIPDPKRYTWLPEDEESTKLEGPRPVLPPAPPPPSSQAPKTKHVSFARSHTLTSFDVSRSRSPPRPQNQERLIDSQPTMQNAILPLMHPYATSEPRVLVLEKPPKRGTMKTQATQTELPAVFRGRVPVTLSPRTIHRVKMVSQGAQTNGLFNGRKLTKSYSEAGQLGTPLGGGHAGTPGKEETEHEPLHRTQSEEPPRSPFLVDTPPPGGPCTTPATEEALTNGDISEPLTSIPQDQRRSFDLDDQEILIDFKPAPVSPDCRALLNRISQSPRRILPLHKTFSDGEIRVERRELVGETGEPSYPHTCRRNHQDPWGRTVRAPVQFSSTPEDLSLLRISSPPDDHPEEEFHENLIRRGLFRKRSVSLEDGVQDLASDDFMLPRSLPTSPTSPTSASAPRRILQSPKDYSSPSRPLRQAGPVCPIVFSPGTGISGMITSPFASSDSLTNDVTRDHSDGIWNESQATVLQADSLALLTPSSRRRHLLLLQHQQRSSMDTEALDIEETIESRPSSPRIRLEPATPVQPLTPRQLLLSIESTIAPSNGRSRGGFRRPSPAPPLSQPQSQSSSEFGLSLARTDSGGRTNTDLSETSTTEDYVTANTSTETGTTTGTSATTSSWSRPPQTSSAAASTSATATAAEGSSFESASSIYSLARSEAIVEEPCSPPPILEETEIPFGLEVPPSPARSSSSSSSGSYDLKDAMIDPGQELEQTAPPSGHASETELDRDEGHRSSSGGYAESPPDPRTWSEEERRRRRKTFTLDFLGSTQDIERSPEPYGDSAEVSPTPSHRHRPRGKSTSARSPHKNNRKRETTQQTVQVQQQQQQITRSPQKEDWRVDQTEDAGHIPTSDDSSCSHHYYMHHHHHHHVHRENADGRHRRTRDSPRRKTTGYVSARRRSNEDKNAAITGSLPRRRSRAADDIMCSRLSPGRYQRSPGHNGQRAVIVESQSPEARLKALSAESLRSVSPGSDSVFYSEGADQYLAISALDAPHCHHCGREVSEEIVRPPAGFADSPEGHRSTSKYVAGHRLYKKFDKRYRSEDRGDRRHRRSSAGRSDVRAKSEERIASRRGSRGSIDDTAAGRKRLHARSTDVSLEILTGREDEDSYVEPYTSSEWIYIGDLEESHVWKRPDSRDGDDEIPDNVAKERRGSQESTESERNFRKKYQAATHRMVHRKSSGEMYKRIQTKCFECDKRVVVKREAGGEFGFRIHGSKPVVVSAIEPDTPAESSGLEVGDIIMSVNGKSVMDATHSEVVRLAHSGTDVLELEVARTCNVLAPRVARPGTKEGTEEAPICSGYLWRKSATSSTTDKWVRRWFALRRDNCLYYYKTDADSQPVGAVMLIKYDVEQTPELRLHSFAIKKQGAPTLRLAADSEEAAARWTTVIKEAIERNDQVDTWLEASMRMREMAACAIQRPDCFGYLSKQQEHARKTSSPTGWSRRYCVLKDAALYFYDDANAEKAFGVACLHGFRVHSSAQTSGGRKHAFELQPPDPTQRNYIFATESEMDKKRWLAALEYSIDRWIKIG